MKPYKLVFVILHYLAIKDTVECVDSIQKLIDTKEYKIIVVDNASPNGTGKELLEKYSDNDTVDVLLNKENLGFAKGNNVGIRYAVKNYSPDFIAVINNDTLILQNDFFKKVNDEYKKSEFALLGPMVMTADGRCDCTPVSETEITREYILNRLKEEEYRTKLVNRGLPNINSLINRLKLAVTGGKVRTEHKDYIHRRENVRIHGCFMIFSKKFTENFDGLNEETFLYHEEEILHIQLMSKGLKTVYLPTLQIYHKEDSATNAIGMKRKEAKKFVYNCSLESCRVLLKVYDQCYKS